MRPLWKDLLTAVWLGMMIPGILLNAFVWKQKHRNIQNIPAEQTEIVSEPSVPLLDSEGNCMFLPINTYLTGVLLSEIPATFHLEAMKAQSVAARTYTWKVLSSGGKHADGRLCMESACCQGYLPEEEFLHNGGSQEAYQKMFQAVEATGNMVISYDGELIEATYFSSSGGSTEAARAVWGTEYPYLQAIESPDENIASVSVIFSAEEFQKLLDKTFSSDVGQWFGSVTYTDGGGVDTIEICGENYSGTQLRSILGLRSTSFQIRTMNDSIVVTTTGYGHRVGMSQYGANAMAEKGYTWQQILQHYYPGTVIHPIS